MLTLPNIAIRVKHCTVTYADDRSIDKLDKYNQFRLPHGKASLVVSA